jgi:hypothetical protein
MQTYRIFLGRNIGTEGQKVSKQQFDQFLTAVVSPIYNGFTISEVQGFWKGAREATTIIEVLTDNEAGINIIAREYARIFSQDAVLVQKVIGVSEFVTVA